MRTATSARASACRHRRSARDPRRLDYRDASIGAPDRLAGEIGSYIPFARTKAERDRAGDPRLSIEERYRNRDEYVGKAAASALDLVEHGYLLSEDVADLLKHAAEHYDWSLRR